MALKQLSGVDAGNNKIVNVANGSASSDAAAFGQVPTSAGSIGGLVASNNLSDLGSTFTARANLGATWKDPVQQAAFSALPANTYSAGVLTATANAVLVVDGVTCVTGQRILVCGEATAANNGIYVVTQPGSGSTPYILTRSADMNTNALVTGATVMVEQGTVGAGSGWFLEGAGPDTLGTTGIYWTKFTQIISGNNPQALGTAAPGTTGFVADSGHVHPTTGLMTNPMTTLGDLIYENATPTPTRLAGSTSATKQYLTQTGTGSVSAAPAWATIAAADLPTGTTSTQGALQLDGTSTDIAALGTQAAGAKGKAADAGHVHPTTGVALLAGATFTGYLAPAVSTLTFGTTIALNAALGNVFAITLTASTGTLSNPTNPVDGQAIRVRVIQDATGSRTLAFGTAYDFGTAGAPTLTTTASKVDILGFEYVASLTKWCYLGAGLGF